MGGQGHHQVIGDQVTHPLSGQYGVIDATAEHPDGRVLVRLNDRWFFADDTRSSWWP